ncbi:hypothetical protein IG631_17134 [Alternaria alternata]|nr:hypothetical protein IG631_17134 [Alternaria alternata]
MPHTSHAGTHIVGGSVSCSRGEVLRILAVGVVCRKESVLQVLIAIFVDGFVRKLSFDTFKTFGSIGLCTLRFGKLFQALGFTAHGALDLDLLLPSTSLTVDSLVNLGRVLDLPTRIGELLGRVLGLWEVLVTPTAFDLDGERDALEPVRVVSSGSVKMQVSVSSYNVYVTITIIAD